MARVGMLGAIPSPVAANKWSEHLLILLARGLHDVNEGKDMDGDARFHKIC
jgi:hypothetical protein